MLAPTLCMVLLYCVGGINASCLAGEKFSGKAKSYDAVSKAEGGEACNFHTKGKMVAGVSKNVYQDSEACGQCLEVTGPNGKTVVVMVVGMCSACKDEKLKLSEDAFKKLSVDDSTGRIDVTWRTVPCDTKENIKYMFKDGSSKKKFGIQVYGHRYPVKSMEVRDAGHKEWLTMTRSRGNFFMKTRDLGGHMAFPIEVRVNASTGAVVEDIFKDLKVGKYIKGQSQFPLCEADGTEHQESSAGSVTQADETLEDTEEESQEDEENSGEPPTQENEEREETSSQENKDTDDESEDQPGQNDCVKNKGGARVHGEGTYYQEARWAAAGGGNCMIDTEGDIMIGALARMNFDESKACGQCVLITGPGGDVHVTIVDSCPECAKGDIDLSEQAFKQISGEKKGRIEIKWRVVDCPVQGNFTLRFKDGSSKNWFGIQVLKHRYGVEKVHIRQSEKGKWIQLIRKPYNFFLKPSTAGKITAPFHIRVTSTNGQTVYSFVKEIVRSQAVLIPTNVQFKPCADAENAKQK